MVIMVQMEGNTNITFAHHNQLNSLPQKQTWHTLLSIVFAIFVPSVANNTPTTQCVCSPPVPRYQLMRTASVTLGWMVHPFT